MSQRRVPRLRSLIRLYPGRNNARREQKLPFKAGRVYVFLGEIPNMPGHCVVAEVKGGRIWSGFHTENFREIPADEV